MKDDFLFPKAELNKRGPKVSNDDSLNSETLKFALGSEKLKNQSLAEQLIETEHLIESKEEELKESEEALSLSAKKILVLD